MASGLQLPFDDLKFDRILLIHALEVSEDKNSLLRQVWKILRDDGRLLLVVPNRAGLWAHADNSPSARARRSHAARSAAGWPMPASAPSGMRMRSISPAGPCPTAPWAWWNGRDATCSPAGGVCLIEAVKDIYAGVPSRPAVVVPRRIAAGGGAYLLAQPDPTPAAYGCAEYLTNFTEISMKSVPCP
ncbi:methyltransferase domain-containing protein [Komagataeibacter rhaeticus]|nr:methyltransferase domain-containing protein [Komagataeibacter rhaeticus]